MGAHGERAPRSYRADVRAWAATPPGARAMRDSAVGDCAGEQLRSASRHASDPLCASPSSSAAAGSACAHAIHAAVTNTVGGHVDWRIKKPHAVRGSAASWSRQAPQARQRGP